MVDHFEWLVEPIGMLELAQNSLFTYMYDVQSCTLVFQGIVLVSSKKHWRMATSLPLNLIYALFLSYFILLKKPF